MILDIRETKMNNLFRIWVEMLGNNTRSFVAEKLYF